MSGFQVPLARLDPVWTGLHGNSSTPDVKSALTHNLDNLGQEDAVRHILLEILDETFVA